MLGLRALRRCFSSSGRSEIEAALARLSLSSKITQLQVKDGGKVHIQMKLDADYRKSRAAVLGALKQIPWVQDPEISVAAEVKSQQPAATKKLKEVGKVIAVSSCKGGVGKSTIAVNLAYSLSKLGYRVGIYDADIYGPSLPTLVGLQDPHLHAPADDPKSILPLEYERVKLMSYGFVAHKSAVLRGPLVSALTHQLLTSTRWGPLDYLVIDMPPGTGDIQITLCQEVEIAGAVIVTTPQKISFVDVIKGIDMFAATKVPTVAVVENMSYFLCGNCKTKHRLFGPGYMNQLLSLYGINDSIELPMDPELAKYSDAGVPLVLVQPDSALLPATFLDLAQRVHRETEALKGKLPPSVDYDPAQGKVRVRLQSGEEHFIGPHALRQACKCAGCVDEFSGRQLFNPQSIPTDVYPLRMEAKGNYAVAVVWSDGHRSSLYPYTALLALAKSA